MSPETKKTLVVFGATGIQGGSVVKAILSDHIASDQFSIRAITRDPSKPAAAALAEQGVEAIKADAEDKDSLRLAFKDAYGVFAVTNFWESLDASAETRQGKNIVDIAKETNIKHLVWSSLPNVSEILPLIDPAADVGKFVKAILLHPSQSLNQRFNIAQNFYTIQEIIDTLNNAGVNAQFRIFPKESFKAALATKGAPAFLQEAIAQILQFVAQYGYFGGEDIHHLEEQTITEPLTSLKESFSTDPTLAKLKNQDA
ncbi:hypothetical protein BDV25DRAFT_168978 [Aspergillus avenaceus]|uniref:NmrA-like domain-containing protein n=1 Tax=Aspergillus avenaceus TaxID=36643 RepID=A0A5N6TMJ4_ASPAV|nr:hypothetical protein BDV25DRAFT_168978 [Aspergillus avenaceus]